MEKICSKCKTPKDTSEFDKKRNGYSSHCKQCRKEYVKDHYDRNRKYYLDKAKKNQDLHTKRYTDYKKTLSCTDCKLPFIDEPYLCDFHHLDKITKDITPSLLKYYSWSNLEKELKKCIPLCANCHRRRHYKK